MAPAPAGQDPREGPASCLDRGQLVAETSRPVPRAVLSPRAKFGLWALRAFVILVSLMVIWTFVGQLH